MNLLLAFLCGIIVTVMNSFNGQLSLVYGTFIATTLIHFIGLITFVVIMLVKKEKLSFKNSLPFYLYTGGIVGVLTVIFNVVSIDVIGVTLLTALGLLGQMIASIILEQNGWIGSIQKRITPIKCISLVIVMIGIGVMML
ncbi:MAG: DMT family transporter [Coprobacillus sp.]